MNKNLAICFTGHRPDKFGGYDEELPLIKKIKSELKRVIESAIIAGHTDFISGMALGVDTWSAEIVLEYKEKYDDIKLICAIPFTGQEKRWNKESQLRYWEILDVADEIHIVCEGGYAPWKMQKRNEWMVDNSKSVIAVWDGTKGGTGNCVKYAHKKRMEIINIYPKD